MKGDLGLKEINLVYDVHKVPKSVLIFMCHTGEKTAIDNLVITFCTNITLHWLKTKKVTIPYSYLTR